MCGRFTLTATPEEVRRLFDHVDRPNFPPRSDIRPTEPIGVVIRREGARRFTLVRWGFIPGWAKDPAAFSLLINARAETALDKPSFRGAMRHGRCLVPASGFIEWRRDGDGSKHPFLITPKGGGLVGFAGLMETWAGADGSEIDTAAILTVDANATVAAVHDRMPAVIAPADFEAWLDTGRVMADAAARLLRPAPEGLFELTAMERPARRAAPPKARAEREGPTPAIPSKTAKTARAGKGDDQLDLF